MQAVIESPAALAAADRALIERLEAALAQGEAALARHQLPPVEAALKLTMRGLEMDLAAARERLAEAEAAATMTRPERIVAQGVDAAARKGGSLKLAKPIQRRLALAILALCGQDGAFIPHTISADLPGVGRLILTDEYLSLDLSHREVLDSRAGGVGLVWTGEWVATCGDQWACAPTLTQILARAHEAWELC